MQTTLIIMAAGKSSRYGSLKQTEIIGPSDVTLMEYSIYDARNIGFTEVILIIRKETQPYFEAIKKRIGNAIRIEFVYQDLKQFTNNIEIDYIREKPWGTAHALLCCKDIYKNSFVVINADYLNGNTYYKIESPNQNLNRGFNQIALAKKMFLKEKEMENYINSFSQS